MIKFKSLLKENPDTVYYKKKTYNYTSPANRCAFFIYKDVKSGKKSLFAYSDNKKQFYSDDPEVLSDIRKLQDADEIEYSSRSFSDDESMQSKYWAQQAIKKITKSDNGGGHLALENVLKGLMRFGAYDDPILKGRIFEVDDPKSVVDDSDLMIESTIPSGKAIIVTFWHYNKSNVLPYKDQCDEIVKFNGYKPEECLYEFGSKVLTYEEFKDNVEIEKKPVAVSTTIDNKPASDINKVDNFKVGDKVTILGNKVKAVVLAKSGLNNFEIKALDSDVSYIPVGSSFLYPKELMQLDTSESDPLLDKVIDDKTQEFVEKRGKLHTTGAKFTPVEKANLEREVDSLEIELKILNDLLKSGEKYYTDNIKNVVATSVSRKLHAKEKEKLDRYSLAAQAEKQYGMPITQIRQKFRGVPLDQLVKKESLYKKLLKALLG